MFGGDDDIRLRSARPRRVHAAAVAAPSPTQSDRLLWVHGNHMGVPAVMTDATGTEHSFPTGYALPGFPGQSRTVFWADLYYNRYRDYDPTTGRYIQADPIGLEGGASPYSYAMNNPLRYSDPTGEIPITYYGRGKHRKSGTPPAPKKHEPRCKPEYGTYSCEYYSRRCKADGGIYYCGLAPSVCARTPDSRWSRCVRKCLQQTDRLYCEPARKNIMGGSDLPCVINIHQMCWQECISSEVPRSTRRY